MKINSVTLNDFRNISDMILLPHDEVNVIFGQNAQGKTNILEAIWLFTGCKSFRGSKDSEFIKFNSEFSKISLDFTDKVRNKKAEIIISDKKKAFLNGVEKKGTTELIGEFYSVIFSPSHLALIKDGPNVRRKFLDTAICQLKPKYATNAIAPFITKVTGTYTAYPANKSASPEPTPAARKAYRGDIVHPQRSTTQSPRLIYPFSGDGIFIIIVATHTKDARSAENTIF